MVENLLCSRHVVCSQGKLVFQSVGGCLISDHSNDRQKLLTWYAHFCGIKAVRRFPCVKQPENPLLLLGQYSDEELEEQSNQQVTTPEKTPVVDCEQANGQIATENEDRNGDRVINSDAPDGKEHALDEYEPGQLDATGADDPCNVEVSVEETPLSGTLDVHSNVDVNTSWMVVPHEESGQYYYWNTVTGETSWVAPDVLVAGSELTGGQETAPDAEKSCSPLTVVKDANPALDVELNGSSTVHIGHHSIASEKTDEHEEKNEPGSLMQEQIDEQNDDNVEDNKEGHDSGQTVKCLSNVMVHEDNDLDNDFCSSVLRHGDLLLERFKSMKGSQAEGNDWISKYILEVEIRLLDAKSLRSFGSSLLPFWVHCERKLKDLEAAFNAKVCRFFIDQTQVVEATDASPGIEGIETGINENDSGVVVSDAEKSYVSAYVDISTVVPKDEQNETAHISVPPGEHVTSTEYSNSHSDSSLEVNIGGSETAQITEVNPETMLQKEVDEDVDMDMDVDMEVEDGKVKHFHTNLPVKSVSFLPRANFDVPPPPDEDWIPPPPPDSEPVPPPPPDDSAEPFYPPPPPPDDQTEPSYPPLPTYSQPVQPLSYTEQYNYTYPNSNFEYYNQTGTQFPANNTYQQAEGCHITVPNPSAYYETLPSSYPGAAQVLINPVESVAYYDLQDGSVIHGPVVSGAVSSGLHGESSGTAIGSVKISSLKSQTEISHVSSVNTDLGGSAVVTEKEPKGTSTIETPASFANSVIESGPVPSAPAATVTSNTAKSAVPNVQAKVLRSKKRAVAAAPPLRSNKKVSSLVNKWKAAKEELHDDEEDEPESAYDILEKKRQREIEKWRKQQIASGEAKDNANFQPLGGDWRERVKRKRAQLEKEDRKVPSADAADINKSPDLGDLSRDLPSGWQAYWDESSKQVYYGNTVTSETTWTRPG